MSRSLAAPGCLLLWLQCWAQQHPWPGLAETAKPRAIDARRCAVPQGRCLHKQSHTHTLGGLLAKPVHAGTQHLAPQEARTLRRRKLVALQELLAAEDVRLDLCGAMVCSVGGSLGGGGGDWHGEWCFIYERPSGGQHLIEIHRSRAAHGVLTAGDMGAVLVEPSHVLTPMP